MFTPQWQLFKKLHEQNLEADMNEGYASSEIGQALTKMRRSFEQELDDEIEMLQQRLAKKQRLQQLLKENPVILEFMNLSRS
jgi:hypothetical protein